MTDSLFLVVKSIAEDMLSLAYLVMDQQGLADSDLKKDTEYVVEASDNPIIKLMFNDYITYIENGHKANSGTMPPISELREWASRKGLPTNNDTLYAIAQYIAKSAQAPRPILSLLVEEMEKSFDFKWAAELFEYIVSELQVFFDE